MLSFDLEHQVFGSLLGIWLGLLLATSFNLLFALIIVVYLLPIVYSMQMGIRYPVPRRERLEIYICVMLITLGTIPALLWAFKHFASGFDIGGQKVAFLGIIIAGWIICVELARFSQEEVQEAWNSL